MENWQHQWPTDSFAITDIKVSIKGFMPSHSSTHTFQLLESLLINTVVFKILSDFSNYLVNDILVDRALNQSN